MFDVFSFFSGESGMHSKRLDFCKSRSFSFTVQETEMCSGPSPFVAMSPKAHTEFITMA